jgi:tetraacyldisaccharide-1-P 4'-kinase
VHAVAGIGNPERFFAHLSAARALDFTSTPFPTITLYRADLAFDDADAS